MSSQRKELVDWNFVAPHPHSICEPETWQTTNLSGLDLKLKTATILVELPKLQAQVEKILLS